MKVLIACEFSGIVRDAFRRHGHDAWSCDFLPTESDPRFHFKEDVRNHLSDGWDLMIAHPHCTYLCNSGVRWLHEQKGRWQKMEEAAKFFRMLLDVDIPRIAIENPVMHGYAIDIVGRNQDFSIQPWQFGHLEKKRTCFWIKDLPFLKPTNILDGEPEPRVHYASPGANRWKERSRTLPGIAEAMAEQWGSL